MAGAAYGSTELLLLPARLSRPRAGGAGADGGHAAEQEGDG